MKCFSSNHFIAILYRKLIIFKRSWFLNSFYLLASLGIASIAIIFQYIVITLQGSLELKGSFSDFGKDTQALVFVNDSSFLKFDSYVEYVSSYFYDETGYKVPILVFQNYTEFNQFTYECSQTGKYVLSIGSSISIKPNKYDISSYNLNLFQNNTFNLAIDGYSTESIFTNCLWKTIFGKSSGFKFTNTLLTKDYQDHYLINMRLLIILSAYAYFIPALLSQAINDVLGNSLLYMKSCGLTIFSYWLATFLIDILFWIVFSSLLWLLFYITRIPSFVTSGFYILYALIMSGPGVLLFNYVLIHLLSSQSDAPRQIFFIFIGFSISQHLIETASSSSDPPFWEEVIASFIPPLSMYRSYSITSSKRYRNGYTINLKNTQIDFNIKDAINNPYKTLFEEFDVHNIYFCHFVMNYANIIIYGILLCLIGDFLNRFNSKKVAKIFNKNKEIFDREKLKASKEMTKEALQMELDVKNSNSTDYFIKIDQVSRLFFDNDKTPILAVNSVSLGIKKGSLFGFLGANGAGKTTLISMITSMLPVSNGTIEIDGENVNNLRDRSIISVCPQFNDHLISEMTPLEHFTLYSYIFNLRKDEALERKNELIEKLELREILNKKLSEISFGDLRKLAVALSFFGNSKVIFLDEPTTSLDSVSRDLVHKLILKNKKTKNILLCTHLLNEAEILCDKISIMSKGCIYTVDSPQNLNKKFGTSIKIDVFLDGKDPNAAQKCENFFNRNVPKANLAIERPNSRIYRISNKFITFPLLFTIMENGRKNLDNGFYSFTCTSSSLEQTFLEIVKLSENGEADASISLLRVAQESAPPV